MALIYRSELGLSFVNVIVSMSRTEKSA